MHSKDNIEDLIRIIQGRGNRYTVEPEVLKNLFTELISSVGRLGKLDAETRAFHEFSDYDETHTVLRARHKRIADLATALQKELRTGLARAELNARARVKLSSTRIRKKNQALYSAALNFGFIPRVLGDLALLTEFATALRSYHASQITKNRPVKTILDDLLMGVADIFIEVTGSDRGCYDLPHAEISIFIRFASGTLRPFFDASETTPRALSRRWERIKKGRPKQRPKRKTGPVSKGSHKST